MVCSCTWKRDASRTLEESLLYLKFSPEDDGPITEVTRQREDLPPLKIGEVARHEDPAESRFIPAATYAFSTEEMLAIAAFMHAPEHYNALIQTGGSLKLEFVK